MDKKLPLKEMILDDDQEFGIQAISIVDTPAIGENFIMLSKEHKIELAKLEEEQVLLGAALIPDQKIYRTDGDEEYEIFFSKETIKKLSQRFLKLENQNQITLQHEGEIKGLGVRESWIVADTEKDKSAAYGLSYPVGTWMVSMHVEDSKLWESIKESDISGFSIEAMMKPKDVVEQSAIDKLRDLKSWFQRKEND